MRRGQVTTHQPIHTASTRQIGSRESEKGREGEREREREREREDLSKWVD